MKTIKYCCRNFDFDTNDVRKALKKEYPEVKQKKKECLHDCKLCGKQPFVMVGRKVYTAKSADKLYKKIKELIEA